MEVGIMSDFQHQIDEALEVLTDEGAVHDTLAELRRHFGDKFDVLLDPRFGCCLSSI